MKWWVQCFDRNWVRCANYRCRAEFWLLDVKRRRKCPKCRMDNRHQLPNTRIADTGGANAIKAEQGGESCY